MSILTLEHVKYQYHGADDYAVKEATSSFELGKLYAIMGPSGSGKSTLLAILAGLDEPTEGTIFFEKIALKDLDLDRYRREDISMVFQAFHLFPLLTVLENVCFPLDLLGVEKRASRERAKHLLLRVGIQEEQFKRFPSQLSGGEQQRVAIARSLASGARVILADEPTGNLDGENTQKIIDILTSLARDEGYCIIIVTHDMDVAGRADVVLRMKDGILIRDT